MRFNPGEYEKLNNSRERIVKSLNKYDILNNKKILDIGCGTGNFSFSIVKNSKKNYIHSIDIVESYINVAKSNNIYDDRIFFENKDYKTVDSKYDTITLFLSFTEILKYNNFEEVLNYFNNLLCNEGHIVLCDEFIENYNDERDILGMKIMEELGYKYIKLDLLEKLLSENGFEVIMHKKVITNSQILKKDEAKLKIYYENKLNEFDNTKKINSETIWNKYKEKILEIGGIRTNNVISYLLIRKQKKKEYGKMLKGKETPFLLYDTIKIKENISYYKDLTRHHNLKFLFPIKTFPNMKILDIFYVNGYGFDVSNKKEADYIKKYKNILVMDSNPTKRDNECIRVNINSKNINSRFGEKIDFNLQYSNIHIHIAEVKTVKIINDIYKSLKKINKTNLKSINIGGGFENLSYYELNEFISKIEKIISKEIFIIMESGSLWFRNSGYLITKIEKIEKFDNYKVIFLDSSSVLHSNWSTPKINEIISRNDKENNKKINNYIISGSTCYEKDIFCTYKTSNELFKNDIIVFSNIEPYSYGLNNSFNGIRKAKTEFYE